MFSLALSLNFCSLPPCPAFTTDVRFAMLFCIYYLGDEPISVNLDKETSEWIVEGSAKEEVVVRQFFEKSVESNIVEVIPQGELCSIKLLY